MGQFDRLKDVLYIIGGCFLLMTPFLIDQKMINGLINGKLFWVQFSMFFLSATVILLEIIRRRPTFHFSLPDLTVILLTGCILATYNWKTDPSPHFLLFWIQILLAWFIFRHICNNHPFLANVFMLFIVLTGGIQALWGLVQIYNLSDSHHVLFRLTGFFPNPGPYSGYLAMILPLATGLILEIGHPSDLRNMAYRFTRTLCWLTVILTLMVLPSGLSRSAWLASLLSCSWVFWKYRLGKEWAIAFVTRRRTLSFVVSLILFLAIVTGISGLYLLKKDSADGRFLMWKVTLYSFMETPFSGKGIGGFPGAYAEAQAQYFTAQQASPQERWVAGTPEAAFNEYLQVLTELGIAGFLCFAAFFASVIYLGIRNKKYYAVGAIISFLLFSLSSYPLRDPSFLPVLMVICVIAITKPRISEETVQHPYAWVGTPLVILVALISLGISWYEMPRLKKYRQWTDAKVLYSNKAYAAATEKYSELYDYVHHDPAYLFEYAQCLGECGEHAEAIRLLKRATQVSSDPMIHCMIGKNKLKEGKYEEAEQYYEKALAILPERIYPYFLMTELYSHPENYQKNKLKQAADSVLYKKPKVESTAVEEMRDKVRKLLLKNKNEQNRVN
ncbi:MAG: O-antigen ligase family protein [Tannerellaceae bacterium]|nr:O-antigen ligase family protein [Tannerellaceae bacterium]